MAAASDDNPTLNEPFRGSTFESLPHLPCVTLYHRDGRSGCGTHGRDVQTGRLLHWTSVVAAGATGGGGGGDVDDGGGGGGRGGDGAASTMPIPPYVAVMEEGSYVAENVARLVYFSSTLSAGGHYGGAEEGGPLRGVLVLASSSSSSSSSSSFSSPEPLAPQGEGTPSSSLSVGSSHGWNSNGGGGDGLANDDMYGLPTAYVRDPGIASYLASAARAQSDALSTAAGEDGGDIASSASSSSGSSSSASSSSAPPLSASPYPSILAEFNYYMGPGGEVDPATGGAVYDSRRCLGWRDSGGDWTPRCAPLGGNSVWAAAGSPIPPDAGDGDGGGGGAAGGGDDRPTVLVATSIDSTSMFHDLSPGAGNAASNALALLMAADLLGSSVGDGALDALHGRIVFAFFQGESYGYLGSRRFLRDVGVAGGAGFECSSGGIVPSVRKRKDSAATARACLHPLRADLTFANLGGVRGMIAVDQVGNLGGTKDAYVQGGDATDGGGGYAGFLSSVMVELSGSGGDAGGYAARASSVGRQDDGTYPLPPTPLSSLVKVSSNAVGGVVLTGYDDAFVAGSMYHSHLDSTAASGGAQEIDRDAIAYAATLLARTAVAAAYQDADIGVDYATAAAYALELLPDPVDPSSETFVDLYECLFEDGNRETLLAYGGVERANDAARTGTDLGMGVPLGTPPNYYVGIYDSSNGQAFVRAGGRYYGSMIPGGTTGDDGAPVEGYGEDPADAFLVRPSLLEMSIFGMLNDFLGRGSFASSSSSGGEGADAAAPTLKTCKGGDDCSSVAYCDPGPSGLAVPTCAGGRCVCGSRSHYHPALDEALSAAAKLGRFEIAGDDEGVSALYAEPYWSNYVGVRIYNDAGTGPGAYAASIGAAFALACVVFIWKLKKTLVKEKVY
jgi:nicastrin